MNLYLSSTYFLKNPNSQRNLGDEDGRDAKGEFQVLRLVPEGVHAQQRADAAAEGCREDQGPLGDAPAIFYGLALVRKHKHECGRID